MPNFICNTCGTQYPDADQPPASCPICQDERQYLKATGQNWTTLERLRLTNRNSVKFREPGLIGVGIEPHFAIGQRALFLRTAKANVLWDCLPLLDEAVVEALKALGGISAIAISHPHCYSSMVEWSRAFGVRRNKARWPMAKCGSMPTPMSPASLNLSELQLVCRSLSRVVHCWPVALTYCRSS